MLMQIQIDIIYGLITNHQLKKSSAHRHAECKNDQSWITIIVNAIN